MMKRIFRILAIGVPVALMSCTGEFIKPGDMPPFMDDDSSQSDLNYDDESEQNENNIQSTDTELSTGSISDLKSFDISLNDTPLSEEEIIPTDPDSADYENYVENYSLNNTIKITWSGNSADISGAAEGVTTTVEGADVVIKSTVKGMRYILSGNGSDAMISIYSDYKFRLDLDNLSLANNDGPAINIQSGKRAYVVVSGENSLSDGSTYASSTDEDRKGTLFSEGQLCFSGNGTLNVDGKYKNGIVSDDYLFFRQGPVINVTSAGTNCLKANDWIHIEGGVLNATATAVGGKCLSSDGYIRINGGRTTLMTTGGVDESDYSSSCCAKSDSIFVMNKGELYCKSTGRGGKGIKADMNAYFNGGKVRVITTGADYGSSNNNPWGGNASSSNTARPKGIRVEGKLFINGGDIMVRVASHEGVESKSYIEINGGRLMIHSYDDAVNSAGELVINGGYIYAQSTNNDGLDSNGNMTFAGGVSIAVGPTTGAECGIDVNEEGRAYITMNGGTVIGLGAGNSTPSTGTQSYCVYGNTGMGGAPGFGGGFGGGRPGDGSSSGSITAGKAYSISSSDKSIMTFSSPINASCLFVSCPELSKGASYTLLSDVNIEGGNEFCGLFRGSSVSGGSTVTTLTATR